MRNVFPHALMMACAALLWCAACDAPGPRQPAAPASDTSGQDSPASGPSYALWIEASGLGGATVRLSIGGRTAIDVEGDGRSLAIDGLRDGASYSVWIDKAPERLRCALWEASRTELTRVNGRVAAADVTLTLSCQADDVRLAKLSLVTRDARMSPDFEPDTLAYSLDAYHVNDRAWLELAAADREARVRVRLDGNELAVGAGTLELPLGTGPHALEVELAAPSGRSRRYEVKLSRRAQRSALTLHVPGVDADSFLEAVALSTDYLAVSHIPSGQAGIVDVFRRTPDGWLHDATLSPTREGSDQPYDGNAIFGHLLAFSGEWLAVAAPGYTLEPSGSLELSPSRGAVFLYRRTAQGWLEQARIGPAERKPYDQFGLGLAMHGDLLAIGNPRAQDIDDGGLVDVYRLGSDDSWSLIQTLRGESLQGEAFGTYLSAAGSHLAVAAPGWERVYVFVAQGAELVLDGTLEAPARKGRSSPLGEALAFGGDLLAIGCDYDSLEDPEPGEVGAGVVNLFRRSPEGWMLTRRLPAPEQTAPPEGKVPPRFGHALAFTTDALWAGAPSDMLSDGLAESGLLYTFELLGEGAVAQSPGVAPLRGSRTSAFLGTTLATSSDGIVAACEPNAHLDDEHERGAVHLLY